MTRTELFQLDLGRYSFSIAWYGDAHWGLTPLSMGKKCTRWRVDFWRFGVRFERY